MSQLSYAYLSAWVFQLLVIEFPRRRRERALLSSFRSELVWLARGDLFDLKTTLRNRQIKTESFPRPGPYGPQIEALAKAYEDSGLDRTLYVLDQHHVALRCYSRAQRTLDHMISAQPAFSGEVMASARDYLSASVFEAFRDFPILQTLEIDMRGLGITKKPPAPENLPALDLHHRDGGALRAVRQYAQDLEDLLVQEYRRLGLHFVTPGRPEAFHPIAPPSPPAPDQAALA